MSTQPPVSPEATRVKQITQSIRDGATVYDLVDVEQAIDVLEQKRMLLQRDVDRLKSACDELERALATKVDKMKWLRQRCDIQSLEIGRLRAELQSNGELLANNERLRDDAYDQRDTANQKVIDLNSLLGRLQTDIETKDAEHHNQLAKRQQRHDAEVLRLNDEVAVLRTTLRQRHDRDTAASFQAQELGRRLEQTAGQRDRIKRHLGLMARQMRRYEIAILALSTMIPHGDQCAWCSGSFHRSDCPLYDIPGLEELLVAQEPPDNYNDPAQYDGDDGTDGYPYQEDVTYPDEDNDYDRDDDDGC